MRIFYSNMDVLWAQSPQLRRQHHSRPLHRPLSLPSTTLSIYLSLLITTRPLQIHHYPLPPHLTISSACGCRRSLLVSTPGGGETTSYSMSSGTSCTTSHD